MSAGAMFMDFMRMSSARTSRNRLSSDFGSVVADVSSNSVVANMNDLGTQQCLGKPPREIPLAVACGQSSDSGFRKNGGL